MEIFTEPYCKKNMLILGLSKDLRGLLVRVRTMSKDSFWHIHSDEMTPYQKSVHKNLLK